MDPWLPLRALVVLALLVWMPGAIWTRVLFPELRGVAAAVASVAISVCGVTLALYLANAVFGVRISGATATWVALAIAAGALMPVALRWIDPRVARVLG